jgi:hypothetical protein
MCRHSATSTSITLLLRVTCHQQAGRRSGLTASHTQPELHSDSSWPTAGARKECPLHFPGRSSPVIETAFCSSSSSVLHGDDGKIGTRAFARSKSTSRSVTVIETAFCSSSSSVLHGDDGKIGTRAFARSKSTSRSVTVRMHSSHRFARVLEQPPYLNKIYAVETNLTIGDKRKFTEIVIAP